MDASTTAISAEGRVRSMSKCIKCHSHDIIESEKGIYCCNCGWDSEKEKYTKKQTNSDRIRSFSDEELAEFMVNKGGYIACCQCDFFNRDEEKCESPSGWLCTKGYAEALIHKWLQSEVE